MMGNKKIKIAFILPKTKGGAYYVYSKIAEKLILEYGYNIEIINSKKGWFLSYFKKYDIIFSVIPFLFKPLNVEKFIYILVGNYTKERKINRIGNKLLYLTPYNFKFSDNIILMNNYLLNLIDNLKKYENKINIIPNFINFNEFKEIREYNIKKIKSNIDSYEKINILTVTGFKFFNKARGVINLKNILNSLLKKYPNKNIIWNIVGNSDNEIFGNIIKEFNNINNSVNLTINWLGWINKEELLNQYKNNDIFLYWTYLDVFPTVLLEASAAGLPLFINNFNSFDEIFSNKVICKSEEIMLDKIVKSNFKDIQNYLIKNSKQFDMNIIIKDFIKIIKN